MYVCHVWYFFFNVPCLLDQAPTCRIHVCIGILMSEVSLIYSFVTYAHGASMGSSNDANGARFISSQGIGLMLLEYTGLSTRRKFRWSRDSKICMSLEFWQTHLHRTVQSTWLQVCHSTLQSDYAWLPIDNSFTHSEWQAVPCEFMKPASWNHISEIINMPIKTKTWLQSIRVEKNLPELLMPASNTEIV